MSKLNLELKTIIFIGIILLFSINTASATVIFQENFETQTSGGFTSEDASSFPYGSHGYYVYEAGSYPHTNLQAGGMSFYSFSSTYYLKLNSTYYEFEEYVYDAPYSDYVYIGMWNTAGVYHLSLKCKYSGYCVDFEGSGNNIT